MDKVRITFRFQLPKSNLVTLDYLLAVLRNVWKSVGATYVKVDYVVLED